MDVRVDRASTGTMWTYGLGSIAVGIKNNLLGTYLLIYYNQVLEVNALLVTAALFIGEFTEGVEWAHLDIAGTFLSEKTTGHMIKGATGVPTRTLIKLVEDLAQTS